MIYLDLFSGGGYAALAHQRLAGHTCAGYVEIDPAAQATLTARIADGSLQDAPIHADIRAFNRDYASSHCGLVDLVGGGFPCQAYSVAGRREGARSELDLWPDTAECVRRVGPEWVHLENVPGLVTHPDGLGRVLRDLHTLGYDARWGVLRAWDVGAWHQRARLWIVGRRRA